MTTRRELLIMLGASAGALAAPLSSLAQQQTKIWRVGFLSPRHVDFVETDRFYGPFRQGMRELGYVEGKNLIIEWRSAEMNDERLPALAAELVNLKVDVIVATTVRSVRAIQKASATMPIVVANSGDPVASGLVQSLARPGGNVTGFSGMQGEVSVKQLEMLMSMVPRLSRLAMLLSPSTGYQNTLKMVQPEAEKRGVKVLRAEADTIQEIDQAFVWMRQQKAGALLVVRAPLFLQQEKQIAELAAKYRLPSIAATREYTEAGGLMSYGHNSTDQTRRTSIYVDKIFKGAKPADLPVEQPTKFELVINGKTAKALGLTIPQALLISANEVIK